MAAVAPAVAPAVVPAVAPVVAPAGITLEQTAIQKTLDFLTSIEALLREEYIRRGKQP